MFFFDFLAKEATGENKPKTAGQLEVEKLSKIRQNIISIKDQGGSVEDIDNYISTTPYSKRDLFLPSMTAAPTTKGTTLFKPRETDIDVMRERRKDEDVVSDERVAKVQQNMKSMLNQGATEQEMIEYGEGVMRKPMSHKELKKLSITDEQRLYKKKQKIFDIPDSPVGWEPVEQLITKFIGNAAGAGDLGGPVPMTKAGEIGAGVGTLGGMVVGAPLKLTHKLVSKLFPQLLPRAGDTMVRIGAKNLIRSTVSLPTMEGIARVNEMVSDPERTKEIMKEVVYGGALTGAEFGILNQVSFPKKIPSYLTRIAGKMVMDYVLESKHPLDQREVADKAYSYAMDLYFLAHGRNPKEIQKALTSQETLKNLRYMADKARIEAELTKSPHLPILEDMILKNTNQKPGTPVDFSIRRSKMATESMDTSSPMYQAVASALSNMNRSVIQIPDQRDIRKYGRQDTPYETIPVDNFENQIAEALQAQIGDTLPPEYGNSSNQGLPGERLQRKNRRGKIYKNNQGGVIMGSGPWQSIYERFFPEKNENNEKPFDSGFYSRLGEVVSQKVGGKINTDQLKNLLVNNGVKPDEMKWSGMNTFLEDNKGNTVTKDQIVQYLKANEPRIVEIEHSDHNEPQNAFDSVDNTKFGNWVEPGGKNYRELLITMPHNPEGNFTSSHWNEPNVLAHVRFNDRNDSSGKKVLYIEEVQSDWHQAGRDKGYKSNEFPKDWEIKRSESEWHLVDPSGRIADAVSVSHTEEEAKNQFIKFINKTQVSPAPFQKTWPEVVMKRMIRYAAEKGYDKIAFTPGEVQNKRYNLSTVVDGVSWELLPNKLTREVTLKSFGGDNIDLKLYSDGRIRTSSMPELEGHPIGEVVGKEVADKIMNEDNGEFSKEALAEFGGSGMKGFYDKMLPSYINKYAKRWGVQVEPVKISTEEGLNEEGIRFMEKLRYDTGIFEEEDIEANEFKDMKKSDIIKRVKIYRDLLYNYPEGFWGIMESGVTQQKIDLDNAIKELETNGDKYFNSNDGEVLNEKGKALIFEMDDKTDFFEEMDENRDEYEPTKKSFIRDIEAHIEYLKEEFQDKGGDEEWVKRDEYEIKYLEKVLEKVKKNPDDYFTTIGKERLSRKGIETFNEWAESYEFDIDEARTEGGMGESKQEVLNYLKDYKKNVLDSESTTKAEWNDYNRLVKKLESDDTLWEKTTLSIQRPGFQVNESMKKEVMGKGQALYSGLPLNEIKDAAKWYEAKAQKVIDYISSKMPDKWRRFWNPLSTLSDWEGYYIEKLLATGRLGKVEDRVKSLFESINKLPDTDKAYQYLVGEYKFKDKAEEMIYTPAIKAKELINEAGADLVERGILDKESYEKFKDKYLPRLYMRFISDEPNNRKYSKINASYAKHRNEKIPEEMRNLLLGEIKDPAYLVSEAIGREQGDIVIHDFLENISNNPDWVYGGGLKPWDSFQALTTMAQSRTKMYRRLYSAPFIKEELDKLNEIYQKFPERRAELEPIIREGQEALDSINVPKGGEGWVQIPDSAKYGSLKGMWVKEEIAQDLKMGVKVEAQAKDLLDKMTTWFKIAKVPLNLPTQVRNVVSNSALLDISGMNFIQQGVYLEKVIEDFVHKGKYWELSQKYGLGRTTFTNEELYRVRKMFKESKEGWLGTAKELVNKGMDIPRNMYGTIETIFKTMRAAYALEREGLSEKDAILKAQSSLFDYSLVSPSIEWLRTKPFGSPFITFQYKVLPNLAEAAVKKPWKFVKYAALPMALLASTQKKYDVSDDDWTKLQKLLPDYIKEYGVWVLPYKDESGRWYFMNFSYFLPWGNLGQLAQDIGKGDFNKSIRQVGLLGAPGPQLASVILTGNDPFTGKSLFKASDTAADKLYKSMAFIYQMGAPPFLTNTGFAGKVIDDIQGRKDKSGKPINSLLTAGRLGGVNIYPVDEKESKRINASRFKNTLGELRKEMYRVYFDKTLFPEERKEQVKKIKERIKEEKQKYKEGT